MHIVFVSDFLFFNVETHSSLFACCMLFIGVIFLVVIKHPYVFEIFSPY